MRVGTLNPRSDLPKLRYTTDSPAPFYQPTAARTEHCCTPSQRRQLFTIIYSVNIPEDTNLQQHLCENLKSRIAKLLFAAAGPNLLTIPHGVNNPDGFSLDQLNILVTVVRAVPRVTASLQKRGTTGL
jgi:hypothetical protein